MLASREPAAVETITAQLETILVRRFREVLYERIGIDSPIEIRDGSYPVLTGLRARPLTATELSQRVGVDRSVASRQAAELVAAGLVERAQDPRDRRGGLLRLTPEGQDVADGLVTAASRVVEAATAGWSETELVAFADRLAAFASALLDLGSADVNGG